ncbi:putative signal transducing protein [Melioribacter sp. Ez-97]|uniref:putative signal transducing protein n=1 Tax=Melioribacter sp. Ez-97 TaxID=3423434 RepID=UPI003ED91427
MICPKCEYEYVEGIKECPDCGTPLVTREEFEGHLLHPEDWVVVYTCSDNIEAEMYKANLESADIETLILSQKDRNYPTVGDLAVIKILVKRDDAESALEIIRDINSRAQNTEEEGDEE